MTKKDEPAPPKNTRAARTERMPPPLGADLIAKLQSAVAAAQHKRGHEPQPDFDPETKD